MLRFASNAGALLIGRSFVAAPFGSLRQLRLDTMTAIYDRRSGQTHIVGEAVPVILAELARAGTADAIDVARALGAPDEVDAVAARLDELLVAGLIAHV